MVFNGEIYNHEALRDELTKSGYKFNSRTDTEVILASYMKWGIDCLEKFNGMWAFILFDNRKKKIFLARDRFGVKPLYYWFSSEGFLALASEIKAFTVLPGWTAILDQEMAYDFLEWGVTDHTRKTLFKGVLQLRPSEAMIIDLKDKNNNLFTYKYYEIEKKQPAQNLFQAGQVFKNLLEDSIRLRMISDVPLGSCLSGGLDSSSIVCLMNELLIQKNEQYVQNTFSAYSEEEATDESDYVEEVVRERSVQSHIVYPNVKGLENEIDDLIWHQDEPFSSTSPYAQWCVFKLAHNNGVIVMLDGQGADEILAGYHNFFPTYLIHLLMNYKFIKFLMELKYINKVHNYSYKKLIKEMVDILSNDKTKIFIKKLIKTDIEPEWFDKEIIGNNESMVLLKCLKNKKLMKNLQLCEIFNISLPKLLRFEDRNSMANSVESRVPFLDYRLVEYSMSLPVSMYIDNGVTKRVLRSGMQGILPEKIRTRMTKLGFATPEEFWIRTNTGLFSELLQNAIDASKGVIRGKEIQRMYGVIEDKTEYSSQIWRAISFGLWMKKFNVQLE